MNGRKDGDKNGDNDWEDRPLAPAEVRKIRRIMRDWDRYEWAWFMIGKSAFYAAVIITSMWTFRDLIIGILKAIFSPHEPPKK